MIFLILALYLKYKNNISLRLQVLRLKLRVRKSIINLRNKEKVDNIIERVRQQKAKRLGILPTETVHASETIAQRMKSALKTKIRLNMIINKVKGLYSYYKKPTDRATDAQPSENVNLPQLQPKNINPALIKQKLKNVHPEKQTLLQSKLKNKIQSVLTKNANDINKQTYCHGENRHPQSQNNQTL